MKYIPTNLSIVSTILVLISCSHFSKNISGEDKSIIVPRNAVQLNMVGHWLGEGKREKLIHEFINEFEFLNQDLKINMKFPEELYKGEAGEIDFIIDQIQKPVADYDIIRIKSKYPIIARILNDPDWGTKYLVDFNTVPGFIEKHLSTLNIESNKRRTGNLCVSPYMEGSYNTLYVNLDVAKKIGITVKQYDMTYEDFIVYIEAVNTYNKTQNKAIIPLFENADENWRTTEALFTRLFYSKLDGFAEINNMKYSEKKILALEYTYIAYEKLSKHGPIRKNKYRTNIEWSRDNDYPLKDSCLFFINGSFMYNIWDGKSHEALKKIMPCELPVFKPSDTYVGHYSSNWCIPKNAPHRDAAIKLMMFWCQPAMAEKWVRYTKCPTGIKGNLTENSFGVDAFEDFQFTINKKYGKHIVAADDYQLIIGSKNNIPFNSTLILGGMMTANEAIAMLRKKLVKN